MTIFDNRCLRSSRSLARQKIAITSDATVMSKPSSRGKPLATPPAAPPLTPKHGPSEGSRRHSIAFLPIWLSASVRPTVVVVLPSPAGVGVILQRLDELHRHLGLVVAVGLEVLGRDAEPFARELHDRPHLGGLRDLD